MAMPTVDIEWKITQELNGVVVNQSKTSVGIQQLYRYMSSRAVRDKVRYKPSGCAANRTARYPSGWGQMVLIDFMRMYKPK